MAITTQKFDQSFPCPPLQSVKVDLSGILRRPRLHIDTGSLDRFVRDRVVFVTGAAGSIGSEICRQALAYHPRQLILFDHWENGLFSLERELLGLATPTNILPRVGCISNAGRVRRLFDQFQPEILIHAAAHKHVPMMEGNPGEAVKNNVLGTRLLADQAIRVGVESFVLISTDKAVNPVSVMGACKRVAEMYIHSISNDSPRTRFVTVRFGNVFGSSGSVVPLFEQQIRLGGPVTVTHPDVTRFFMTITEATHLVLQASALGHSGDTLVLDMGEPVRVLDLARDLIHLLGAAGGREIEIVFTGLRPGEKLHEALFNEGEDRLATANPLISRVGQRVEYQGGLIRKQLDMLANIVDHPDDEVIAALREMLPDYSKIN